MKNTIILTVLISAFLTSCNETKHKHETTDASEVVAEPHEKQMTAASHLYNNDWVNEIQLNKGSKWEANIETTQGVDKMLEMVKSSSPKTTDDYHNLASQLNNEKIIVIMECTMEGMSHDNLHIFLHPLIEKIDSLLQTSSEEEGSKIVMSIQENLEAYYNYFK
jgi:hypothetical protein